jgi:hypothetical protein
VSEPRAILVARNYAELTDGIATRLAELRVDHLAVDDAAGLTSGHTGKLLAPDPTKNYGPKSLDAHLEALGLCLIVAVDPERSPRISDTRKIAGFVPNDVQHRRRSTRLAGELFAKFVHRNVKKAARASAANRMSNRSAAVRSQIARTAALARWSRRQPIGVNPTDEVRSA